MDPQSSLPNVHKPDSSNPKPQASAGNEVNMEEVMQLTELFPEMNGDEIFQVYSECNYNKEAVIEILLANKESMQAK